MHRENRVELKHPTGWFVFQFSSIGVKEMVIVEKIVWKRGLKCPCIICLEYTSSARCGNEMENISCNFPYIHNGSDNKNPTEGNKLKCWTTFSWNTCDCKWNRKLLVWFGTRHQSLFFSFDSVFSIFAPLLCHH